jgi:methyltransferase
MSFGWAHLLIAFVAVQRLAELAYARRNIRTLLARGGIESGAGHYPLFVGLQGGWLAAMFLLVEPNPEPRWLLLAAFALLQGLRVWVIASLGPYWTTRVIVVPGAVPVTDGPYRWLRHPNYLIVALEVPILPLALGLPWVALAFGALNVGLLFHRIRVENRARRGLSPAGEEC